MEFKGDLFHLLKKVVGNGAVRISPDPQEKTKLLAETHDSQRMLDSFKLSGSKDFAAFAKAWKDQKPAADGKQSKT